MSTLMIIAVTQFMQKIKTINDVDSNVSTTPPTEPHYITESNTQPATNNSNVNTTDNSSNTLHKKMKPSMLLTAMYLHLIFQNLR